MYRTSNEKSLNVYRALTLRADAGKKMRQLGAITGVFTIVFLSGVALATFGKSLSIPLNLRTGLYVATGTFGVLSVVTGSGTLYYYCAKKSADKCIEESDEKDLQQLYLDRLKGQADEELNEETGNEIFKNLFEAAENCCINRQEHPTAQIDFNGLFMTLPEGKLEQFFTEISEKDKDFQGRIAFVLANACKDEECRERFVSNLMSIPFSLMGKISNQSDTQSKIGETALEKLQMVNKFDASHFTAAVRTCFGKGLGDKYADLVVLSRNLSVIKFGRSQEQAAKQEIKKFKNMLNQAKTEKK